MASRRTFVRFATLVATALLLLALGACDSDGEGGTPCDCAPESACTATAPECQDPPQACESIEDCDDGNVCTLDSCGSDGFCSYTPSEATGCCTSVEQCDDGRLCTEATCESFRCVYTRPDPECCDGDEDCEDGSWCTQDFCRDGRCRQLTPDPTCCENDAACDDGDPCTIDECLQGTCAHRRTGDGCTCDSSSACDDGNPCTVERCVDWVQCVYEFNANSTTPGLCCQSDLECDDGDPRTLDQCKSYMCLHIPQRLCYGDADCDDGDECTENMCLDGACVVLNPGASCCAIDADCDDGNRCTLDYCSESVCVHEPLSVAGCCVSDGDCDDGVACTIDRCVSGQCSNQGNPECCGQDSDCPDDGNPCTREYCQNSTCTYEQMSDCCDTDAQCNDNNPCTDDRCQFGSCYLYPIAGCCAVDADCEDENPCTQNRCQSNQCQTSFIPECCVDAAQCNDGDPCTQDTCGEDGTCVYTPREETCQSNADCPPPDACQTGRCQACQCVFTEKADCCLVDGDCDDGDDVCSVDTCVANACVYTLTGADNCCLADSDCDDDFVCTADTCGTDHQCVFTDIPDCCLSVADCAPADSGCYTLYCIEGVCTYEGTGTAGCCSEDAECGHSDPCKAGTCDGTGTCVYSDVEGCCHEDADCDDQDDVCTIDSCVDNWCRYTPTGAEGCCEVFEWLEAWVADNSDWEFENSGLNLGGLGDIIRQFLGDLGSLGWQYRNDGLSVSAPGALYYGNPSNNNYKTLAFDLGGLPFPIPGLEDSPNDGTATSPLITLPELQSHELRFACYLAIEAEPSRDLFTVSVKVGSTLTEIWSKEEAEVGPAWGECVASLAGYEGQSFQLVFAFDTVDIEDNTGAGIYLDDIRVVDTCSPH